MKILVQSLYYPPKLGGVESHAAYLSQQLVQNGHDVTVITSWTEADSPREEVLHGVKVVRVPMSGQSPIGWLIHTLRSIPQVLKYAKDADILHGHTFPTGVSLAVAKFLFKKPIVLTIHTSHFLRMAPKPHWKFFFKHLFKRVDLLLAPSVEIRDVVDSVKSGKACLSMVNAVDCNLFQYRPSNQFPKKSPDQINLLCTRRFVEKNGVQFAIQALPLVAEKYNVVLYLVGLGPLEQELKDMAIKLNIQDRVVFVGPIQNHLVPEYLCAADIVVIPSLLEATSISGLEAMACERPIVASNIGGLPEIIGPENGALFEMANVKDCAEKIISVIESDRVQMGLEARKKVLTQWSLNALANFHEEQFSKINLKAK